MSCVAPDVPSALPHVVRRSTAHRNTVRRVRLGLGLRISLCSFIGAAQFFVSGWCMADEPRQALGHATAAPTGKLAEHTEERKVSPTSLAMGGASTIALAAHGAFLELASRRRLRLARNCGDLCPDYRVENYKEARRMAALSLSVGVLAAASSIWLVYHQPDDLLRLAHKAKRQRHAGVTFKLKPKKGGVWATMVARF